MRALVGGARSGSGHRAESSEQSGTVSEVERGRGWGAERQRASSGAGRRIGHRERDRDPAVTDAADIGDLLARADSGAVRAIARLLSVVEVGGDPAAALAAALVGRTRTAVVIGLTGAPGAGKSTITAALVGAYRARGARVAVLAVDPSSPFTGGALLGDRVRMGDHVLDHGVFIRSMSSRGHLGGLAAATPAAVDLLAALGFDVVLIETVGVGQSEVDVMDLADTVAVAVAPGMGDGIQAAKAGILEIADVLVVNKADHDGARSTVRDLKSMVALGRSGTAKPREWRIPVLSTVAVRGVGIDELVAAFDAHHKHLHTHRDGARTPGTPGQGGGGIRCPGTGQAAAGEPNGQIQAGGRRRPGGIRWHRSLQRGGIGPGLAGRARSPGIDPGIDQRRIGRFSLSRLRPVWLRPIQVGQPDAPSVPALGAPC